MKLNVDKLKEILESKNMSQTELADKIEVSKGAINHYLSGRNEPTEETLIKIANVLEIPPEDLTYTKTGPHLELINILTQLTLENKIKWQKQGGSLTTSIHGLEYEIYVDGDEGLTQGLYNITPDNGRLYLAGRDTYNQELSKLLTLALSQASGVPSIYSQIDELKKLLDEDKNANI